MPLKGLLYTLPESNSGTFKDLLLSESSRQLVDYDLDLSDESNEDWELWTLIAPPMTFHEEAKVILIAGTSTIYGSSGFVWSETLTELVSDTLTHKLRDILSVEWYTCRMF